MCDREKEGRRADSSILLAFKAKIPYTRYAACEWWFCSRFVTERQQPWLKVRLLLCICACALAFVDNF